VAPEVGRWGARAVAAAGILLASLVWAALGVVAWNNAYNELAAAEQRNELVVRVMENHVTRTVETASVALASLGDAVGELREFDATRLGEMLNQMLIGMPYLRSVAVMDAEGRVLASTSALDRDLRISPALLAPLPPLSQDVLLPFLQGRGLGGFQGPAPAQGAPDPASAGVGSLPLLRHVMGPRGRDLYLVALINVDALANIDQGMLMDGGVALLADYSGLLLASTAGLPLMPGAKLTHLPVFASHLLAQDHGSYRGEGVNPSKRLVAFRASQTRPLVLIVEQSFDAVLQAWRLALVWYVVLGAIATALIAAFSVLTLRSLQELIFRTDVLGRISYVNTQWLGKRGDAAEGAVGRFLQELVEPRHRAAVAAVFAPDNLSLVRHVSASMRAVDGQLHHFDIAVVPLLDSGGTLQGFVGSAVDVTERRDAQRQLEQQLAFTELLRESSPLPLAMFDTKGRYRMVNKAWEDFLGRGRKDLQGEPAGKFSSPLEAEPFSSLDPDWDVEGGRRVAEHVVRDLYGRKRDMLINKSLVPDGRGGIVGVLCTLVDVSEIRAAERITREAAEAAQEASRAKNEFVANMSHELRTPLQSILGFSELGQLKAQEHPRLHQMFTDIQNAGQRMLALVNDLLDVAKIESAVGTFELERCDLRMLVRQVAHELDPLMAKRAIRLRLVLDDAPLLARLDPVRVQQVIRNLMANAIKFSPEGGVITVTAGLGHGNGLHLSVADQGPGIPEAELEAIFEAFVQSTVTKDGAGGTGLGLAIARKIVEIHGGRIYAESGPQGGAVFHILLPGRDWPESQIADLV